MSPALGSRALAGAIATFIFFLAHVPLWGWAAALTTLVSGAILTAVYLWRADVLALILAHVSTDVIGLIVGPRM